MTHTIPTTPAEIESGRIIERPDGFYWESVDEGCEYGPFRTLVEAVLDMQAGNSEEELDDDDSEAVREVGEALGVPDWVDPETGHLADDEWTRTEDH